MSKQKEVINGVELYDYNIPIYKQLKVSLNHSNKTSLVHMTSGGKSYIICALLRNYKKSLILVPSTAIMHNWLANPYLPDHTDVMTYQNLLFDFSHKLDEDYEVIIYDEMHHAGAPKWQLVVTALQNKYAQADHVGLSATPIRYLDSQRNVSEELFENNLTPGLSILSAIDLGIILPPVYVAGGYIFNRDETHNVITSIYRRYQTYPNKKYSKIIQHLHELYSMDNNHITVGNILRKYIENNLNTAKCLRFILFAQSIKEAYTYEALAKKWFELAFPNKTIKVYNIHSGMHPDDIAICTELYHKNDPDVIHVLVSVDMITEGVHYPCNGIILLRKTQSPNVYFQQIGRCINPASDEPALIFDFIDNYSSMSNTATNINYTRGSSQDILMEFLNRMAADDPFSQYIGDKYKTENPLTVNNLFKELLPEEYYAGVVPETEQNALALIMGLLRRTELIDVSFDFEKLFKLLRLEIEFDVDQIIEALEQRVKDGKSVRMIKDDDGLKNLRTRVYTQVANGRLKLTEMQKDRLSALGVILGPQAVGEKRLLAVERIVNLCKQEQHIGLGAMTKSEQDELERGKLSLRRYIAQGLLPQELIKELSDLGIEGVKTRQEQYCQLLLEIINLQKSKTPLVAKNVTFLKKIHTGKIVLEEQAAALYQQVIADGLPFQSDEEVFAEIYNALLEHKEKYGSYARTAKMPTALKKFYTLLKNHGIEGVYKEFSCGEPILISLNAIGFNLAEFCQSRTEYENKSWLDKFNQLVRHFETYGHMTDLEDEDLKIFLIKTRNVYIRHLRGEKGISPFRAETIKASGITLTSMEDIFIRNCILAKIVLSGEILPTETRVSLTKWTSKMRNEYLKHLTPEWKLQRARQYGIYTYLYEWDKYSSRKKRTK